MPALDFTMYIQPVGKERPYVTRSGAFTPKKTKVTEQAVRDAWADAGRVRIDGPVRFIVAMYFTRPQNHFNSKGELNKRGLDTPYPTKRPDWDNVGKLVADSLNSFAWRDDADIVEALMLKLWAKDGFPKIRVQARSLATLAGEQIQVSG